MALNKYQKAQLKAEIDTLKYYELNEANKKHSIDKNRFLNLDRFNHSLRREQQYLNSELKAREIAAFNEKSIERDEALSRELSKVKCEEMKQLKMRQILRENSPELRELESQLRRAYVAKELTAQIAEKERERLRDKILEKESYKVLQTAFLAEEERNKLLKQEEINKKAIYKQELQDQMIVSEKRKRFLYDEFLREKKMIDDVIQRIHDEDEREIEEKMCKLKRTRLEMDAFRTAQQIWRKKERDALEEENRKIQEFLMAKALEMQSRQQKKDTLEAVKAQVTETIAKQLAQEEAKRKEREEIVLELLEQEQRDAAEQRHREDVERQIRQRLEVRSSLDRQMQERERRLKQQAEEDASYKEQLLTKIAEDNRLELMSEQKRRMKMLQLRRDVEEMMTERRQRRAEEMQVKMKLQEQEVIEREERKRIIEEERLRMLKEHAKNLIGYLPRGVLRTDDLPHLGSELVDTNNSC